MMRPPRGLTDANIFSELSNGFGDQNDEDPLQMESSSQEESDESSREKQTSPSPPQNSPTTPTSGENNPIRTEVHYLKFNY